MDSSAQCLGKIKFDDAATAHKATAHKAAARKPGRNVYRCSECNSWHVGRRKFKATFKRPAPTRRW